MFVEFLAQSGLRIREAIALRWGDVDFGRGRVKVQRRLYRGVFAPPKTRYGRRQVRFSKRMARALAARRETLGHPGESEPLFASTPGTPLDASNIASDVFKPAAPDALGWGWATFHTLRHTCATMLFRHGLNAKQVQMWLWAPFAGVHACYLRSPVAGRFPGRVVLDGVTSAGRNVLFDDVPARHDVGLLAGVR